MSAGACLGSTQYFLFQGGFVNVVQFNHLPQDYIFYIFNFDIWGKSEAFHNTYLDASQKGVDRDQPQEVRTPFKEIAKKCIDKQQKIIRLLGVSKACLRHFLKCLKMHQQTYQKIYPETINACAAGLSGV